MLTSYRPISVTDALTGKQIRLTAEPTDATGTRRRMVMLQPGALLCLPILGYWPRPTGFTVYVAGTTPASLRTAVEEGRTSEEVLFGDISAGIQEIELEDCRSQVRLLPAPCRIVPLVQDGATLSVAA
ncbi:hypothetical protein [Hymenobacter sp. B81]|uniref:hypothetical protein n=1 Tax=Hymenobacter sp. B81 TaxID=3344878 RepID=UPI0037DDAF9C